jgi:hypothetical protein
LARSLQRQERQVIARKVLSAARIGQSVFLDMLTSGHDINCHTDDGADKAATGRISTALGVSVAKAKAWMTLSSKLSTLPTVTAAFLDGDQSVERIRIIADEIIVLPDADVRAFAETRALEIADGHQADTTLRDQVAEMVIALDPDGAADRREDAGRTRSERTRASGHERALQHLRLRARRDGRASGGTDRDDDQCPHLRPGSASPWSAAGRGVRRNPRTTRRPAGV